MEKLVRKKKIIVPKSKIPTLMARFGCGTTMVYNALAFRTHSDLACKIRKMAMAEFGGRNVYVLAYTKEVDDKY